MKSRRPAHSPLVRRLLFGYTVPLVVLMVAGLALPVFLWIWLDRFRVDFENQMVLADRVAALRNAAFDVQEKRLLAATTGSPARRRALADARDNYRNAAFRVREWAEITDNQSVRIEQQEADGTFRLWLRQPVATSDEFERARDRFDAMLNGAASRERELFEDFRQVQALRRTALIAFPILSVVLALLVGRAVAMGLVRPLIELSAVARRLERGDDATDLLDPALDPPDEIGDLRTSFRSMSTAIHGRESQLRARNTALTAIGRRLEAVLNATEEGIAMLDPNGVLTLANDRFSELLEIDARPWLGKPFPAYARVALGRFRDANLVLRFLRRALEGIPASRSETFELKAPRHRVLRIASAPVRSPRSTGDEVDTLGRIIVMRDVTRETEVDRMKTEFVSTVSHELRTPLTAIKGYVDLILGGQTGPLSETQREFLSLTSDSTERLTALINDILDISRIEQGGVQIRRVPVRYSLLVSHALQMLDGQARARRIVLESDRCDPDWTVFGDPDRIAQVLFNLISNGIKYTPPGGTVRVQVSGDEANVSTSISDTGIGIAPGDKERVFERFYRSDNSSTRAAGGTGLGLAISKAIVERMGGKLEFESNPGQGSTFHFTLPRADTAAEGGEPVPDDASVAPRLFLVVDGDAERRARIANLLRQHRIAVSTAGSRREAFRRAKGLRPDLVLIDPLSPGLDAKGLIADIVENASTSTIPVALTGHLDQSLIVEASNPAAWTTAVQRVAQGDRSTIWVLGSDDLAKSVRDAFPRASIHRPDPHGDGIAPPPTPSVVVSDFENFSLAGAEAVCTGVRPPWVIVSDLPSIVEPIGVPFGGPVQGDHYARRGLERLRRIADTT